MNASLILVSGFIESSIRSIYEQYASNKASPKVANFVGNRLRSFQNPRMDKILDLSGAFSAEWRDELDKAPDEAKSAINSIVANRNRIAHREDVGLTYGMMCAYYRAAMKIIDTIDGQCKGRSMLVASLPRVVGVVVRSVVRRSSVGCSLFCVWHTWRRDENSGRLEALF